MATRKTGATTRPASGATKSRDKGTRGGRPEASATAVRQGTKATRPGTGQGGPAQAQRARTAPVPVAAAEVATAPPAWFQWTTWVLSLGGLAVSVYLTIAHFNQSVSLVCPASSTINCEKVTTSPESYLVGIPVAVLGLAFYLFMAAVNSPWAWRVTWPPLHWARIGSVVAGMLFVLYLIYCELFRIGAICLWCTSIHVITFCLFGLIVFSAAAGYGMSKPAAKA